MVMRLGEFFPTKLTSPCFPSYLGLPGLTPSQRKTTKISRKISPRLVTSSKTFSTPAFNSVFQAQGGIASPAIRCFWWASCESTPSLRPERKNWKGGNKTWIFSQKKSGKITVTSLFCSVINYFPSFKPVVLDRKNQPKKMCQLKNSALPSQMMNNFEPKSISGSGKQVLEIRLVKKVPQSQLCTSSTSWWFQPI